VSGAAVRDAAPAGRRRSRAGAGARGTCSSCARRWTEPDPARHPDIAARIQRVSDTEFNVDRAVVDKILENQAELMRSARIVPEQKDGKVVGIRLFGIRPDTLLGTLGFQNGDRLESINGFNMASPEKALEAYARLRTASNLNVKINRRGQTSSIDYRIK
jgi:general secretion pathway protein C